MKGTGTNRGVHREQPREGWAGPAGGGLWLVERQGTEEERRDDSRRGRHECLRHVDQPSPSKNVETPERRFSGAIQAFSLYQLPPTSPPPPLLCPSIPRGCPKAPEL